jgi:uncharacterized protein YhhL (DUF1145 family)
MLFDLDDAKKQFLHFYPLLTVNIEAPFAANVKVFIEVTAFTVRGSWSSIIMTALIC